jgi:hypothetical protein
VVLFNSSSRNTHQCRFQGVLVNQRHNSRTQRPARFLREGKPSHPKTAGPTRLPSFTLVPFRNPLFHSLFPTYHPDMIKASVNEILFLFLFSCEKCHKPITAWSRTPKPGTLEEAEKHVLPLHCVKECGWSSAKMGSEAIASWAVPWHHENEK